MFQAIGFWLLVLAVPLWSYRWYLASAMAPREHAMFKRLIQQRHESAIKFGFKILGFLVLIAVAVLTLVFGLRYLKYGDIQIGAYRDMMHSRLYSGVDPFDQALDTFHYDQMLPVAIITTCVVLSIGFTLVTTAFRDISVIRQIKRRLAKLSEKSTASTS